MPRITFTFHSSDYPYDTSVEKVYFPLSYFCAVKELEKKYENNDKLNKESECQMNKS